MTSEFRLSVPADIPALRRLWQEAFGDPEGYLDLFFSTAYRPGRCMVLSEANKILAAAYWLTCRLGESRLAYVYAVAVDRATRGRGLGKGLMTAVEAHLARENWAGVLLVPGEESLRMFYVNLGYSIISRHHRFTAAPGVPIPIRVLSPAEYAEARRALLPENGVIQEEENLEFLSKLAVFYRGDGFLAAVTAEGCLEFLGDLDKAPGLTAALGRDSLPLCTPGGHTPYAMGKSLTSAPLPESLYFGFGFD